MTCSINKLLPNHVIIALGEILACVQNKLNPTNVFKVSLKRRLSVGAVNHGQHARRLAVRKYGSRLAHVVRKLSLCRPSDTMSHGAGAKVVFHFSCVPHLPRGSTSLSSARGERAAVQRKTGRGSGGWPEARVAHERASVFL